MLQVLGLLRLGGLFLRVATSTVSVMMAEQGALSEEYLLKPLFKPLLQISVGGMLVGVLM